MNANNKSRFVITTQCDPYNSSKYKRYVGKKVLERDGATPTKWISDDNFGNYYTIAEARAKINEMYNESECHDRYYTYFGGQFTDDIWTYGIVDINKLQ